MENPADNCHFLSMSPSEMEPELRSGLWLVLLVAVWSVPDRDAIELAVGFAKEFRQVFKVAIRPFDCHDEIASWCSGVKEKRQSPIWLYLRNGEKVAEKVGRVPEDRLRDWIRQLETQGTASKANTSSS